MAKTTEASVEPKKYFGTDGIRNCVGQGLIRPDQVLKLGWAVGKVIRKRGEKSVMIGKDTRVSGYMFESALEAGFIAAGIDVYLLGPLPTPAVAYLTQTFSADAGVVISASHNPHTDNGIKFFNAKGRKLTDALEHEIEAMFDEELVVVESSELGRAQRVDDAAGRYIEFCKSTYGADKGLSGLKIVIDCANGAAYHVGPAVFKELGANVVAIANQPDGVNINAGCGATSLSLLQARVVSEGADFGIAFDGDSDRVMMVTSDGDVVDGDAILYILATNVLKDSGVVGTLMSNLGLENALRARGIEFIRADVGDRYVMKALLENGWRYGSEQSGHVLCLDQISTGDGIVAALQVVSIIIQTQSNLQSLLKGLKVYPQKMINVSVKVKKGVSSNARLNKAVAEAEKMMAGKGRVLVRASGTEAVIRVMIEAETENMINDHMHNLVNVVKSEF